ncbi:RsbRD N-terminal domain-containing protein [Thermodesulfovibrio sp. 3907-1M]|uniref:RsbRD N-terminal domain-containing protein n=1 Tax=Thermodesulfovibrio autotrophicus TaxID=3118333 RepID=A0AAU8GUP7_9BACT
MTINDLLSKKKESIVEKSFNLTISTYPENTQAFFKEKKKQFTNPVGYTIYQGIQDIIDRLINDESLDSFIPPLEEIIKIRAVQDFSPSQAVGFIFFIKKAIYDELRKETEPEKLAEFLSQIDSLALVAFDIFMKYREKIYDIKAKELIDRTWWILKKWNIVSEIEDETVGKTKNL